MIWWNCGPEHAGPTGVDDPMDALVRLVREWFEDFADEDTSVAVRPGRLARPDGGSDVHVRCCVRHHPGARPGPATPPPAQAVPDRPGERDLVIAVGRVSEVPGAVCEALVADAPATFVEIRLEAAPSARPAVVDLRTARRHGVVRSPHHSGVAS